MTVLVIIMIVFSFLSIVFSAINKTSNNIKSYAVHKLTGATPTQINLYAVSETFIFCLLGFLTGYMWYYCFYILSRDYIAHPVFAETNQLGCLISALFIIISCLLTYLFVYLKMQNYSVAELIRGREVKKRNNLPLYKSLTFVMFLFASVCITFITSYMWQVEHMDKYQYNYWKRNVDCIILQSLPQAETPEVRWEYDIAGLEDYSVDICINYIYGNQGRPCVRGWFYKGDFNVPEMTEGRFFTQEECSQVLDIAVVGKNVLKDFVVEKDGKRILTYEGKDYEVIGIVGREGHETTIDDWVFLTAETVSDLLGMRFYPILIEGQTDEITEAVLKNIEVNSEGRYIFSSMNVNPHIDLGISNNFLMIFVVLILLTVIVFSVYYIDKIKYIINVKKFIGYSRWMIFADTAVQFISISSLSFFVGNGLMLLASKTLLNDVELFSDFQINFPILALSYGVLLLLSFVFSVIAINKAFRGSARDLKKNQ
ncbi:MAG: ABC transporter permease [Clostridia bacterium]|nr:ABC transporter permease [Clostridia bacterium]